MKQIIYLLSFLFFCSFTIHGQEKLKKEKKEKIKAYKIAYLTEELNLTTQEAQKFWPVYNTFENKMIDLRFEEKFKIRKQIKKAGGLDELTENQAKEIALKMSSLKIKIHEITKEFQNKLPEILPYKKIIKLNIAEEKFHRKLIKKLRNKRKM